MLSNPSDATTEDTFTPLPRIDSAYLPVNKAVVAVEQIVYLSVFCFKLALSRAFCLTL